MEALLAVFENRRSYPPLDENGNRRDISFEVFLFGVIRGKVSHDYESRWRRVEFNEHDESQSLEEWIELIRYKEARSRGCDMSNPETDAMYKESCDRVRALVANYDYLSKLVELLLETPDLTQREIAEKLNIRPDTVYNVLRRLHRLVKPRPRKRREK